MSEIDSVMLFSGNANIDLAREVSDQLGIPLGNCTVSKFSDGEAHIEILENVRGRDVFVLQPTCAPTNDHLMEMLIMVDALYRASAGRITAVIPYYGYARQDRRVRSRRVPISAKLVADMISTSRVDRVLTIDLHSDQIQGFFDLPVDNIYASAVLLDDINEKKYENLVVVSPDVGGVVRARAMTKSLESLGGEVGLAIIDKRRPEPNVSAVMHIIGEVENKTCVIIDDMVDTAGTLCHAAKALKDHGAKQVIAYATHPVFSGPAINNIENSELDEVVVTNTIPLSESGSKCAKIRQLSVASILSDTISRVHVDASVSDLFSHVVDD